MFKNPPEKFTKYSYDIISLSMKVNSVKQFVKSNISRLVKNGERYPDNHIFHLYDKNNVYRGEYQFIPINSNGYQGIRTAMSTTRIMSDKLKPEMQEIIYIDKNFVNFYDSNSKDLLKMKPLPTEITITTTIMDFINDKFTTFRTVSKFKNKLQRMQKDNPNFIYSDNFVIYEPLNEKPQYEKTVEVIREGSISETEKDNRGKKGHSHQIPYMYW